MRRHPLFGAALAGILLLTACSGGGPGVEAADPGAEPSATHTADGGLGAPCLVGEWLATEQELSRWANAVLPTGPMELVDVSGTSTFAFAADGGYTLTPAWGFTLVIADADMRGDADVTGAIVGNYATSGSTLTTTVTDASSVHVEVSIVVNDVSIPTDTFEVLLSDAFGVNPINSSPYDCSGDGLTLHFDTGTGLMEMHLERT